jgi:hypothetical protein
VYDVRDGSLQLAVRNLVVGDVVNMLWVCLKDFGEEVPGKFV